MYVPEYFKPQEFVPPSVYSDRGIKSLQLIDYRILKIADYLRDKFGIATINNWHIGGERTQSGLRIPGQSYYRPYSQHSFGRAIDIVFREINSKVVRDWLRNNSEVFCLELNIEGFTIEDEVSWLHIDVRNNKSGLNSFKP